MFDKLNKNISFKDIDDMYSDICQLNILSGIEIDKAKKEFEINSKNELDKLRVKYVKTDNKKKKIKPYFFEFISKHKKLYNPTKNNYMKHDSTMDYLEEVIDSKIRKKEYRNNSKSNYIKFYELLNIDNYDESKVNKKQIRIIVEEIQKYKLNVSFMYKDESLSNEARYKLLEINRREMEQFISSMKINNNTMIKLLMYLDNKKYKSIYLYLFSSLFGLKNLSFFDCIKNNQRSIDILKESTAGDIILFGHKYIKYTREMNKK